MGTSSFPTCRWCRPLRAEVIHPAAARCLEAFRRVDCAIIAGVQAQPFADVATGAAGLAYALSRASNEPSVLQQVFRLLVAAGDESGATAFAAARPGELDPAGSVLFGEPGVDTVAARFDERALERLARRDMPHSTQPEAGADLALGSLGRLLTAAELLAAGVESTALAAQLDQHAGELLIPSAMDRKLSERGMLGVAHGGAGILYTAMRVGRHRGDQAPPWLEEWLVWLADQRVEHDDAARWPLRAGGDPEHAWPGWCNGSAGYTLLWCEAYEQRRESRWLVLAGKALRHAASRLDSADASLCCGAAGIGFAALRLHDLDPGGPWLELAKQAEERCWDPDLRPGNVGLMYGSAGALCLSADLAAGRYRGFPLFELSLEDPVD